MIKSYKLYDKSFLSLIYSAGWVSDEVLREIYTLCIPTYGTDHAVVDKRSEQFRVWSASNRK